MQLTRVKLMCRNASVWIKIGAGIVGMVAAVLWYFAAQASVTAEGAALNVYAAASTGIAMLLQSIAAAIDAWIPPTASWA